jgi:hypothetical protein
MLVAYSISDNVVAACDGYETSSGDCYLASQNHDIDLIRYLFDAFSINGNDQITESEFTKLFWSQDDNGDGMWTPREFYDNNADYFNLLCERPEYKAYFADQLANDQYNSFGSDSIFDILLDKYQDRIAARGRNLQEGFDSYAGFSIFDGNSDGLVTL